MNILIVEDFEINIHVLSLMLRKLNFTVQSAKDGLEALNSYKTRPVPLIFMDLRMPVMDGFEATKLIREFEVQENIKPAYIVALSAGIGFEDTSSVKFKDFNHIIQKPINMEELEQLINSLPMQP